MGEIDAAQGHVGYEPEIIELFKVILLFPMMFDMQCVVLTWELALRIHMCIM